MCTIQTNIMHSSVSQGFEKLVRAQRFWMHIAQAFTKDTDTSFEIIFGRTKVVKRGVRDADIEEQIGNIRVRFVPT